MDLVARRWNLPLTVGRSTLDGTGVLVAVLDRGIDTTHRALEGAVIAEIARDLVLGPPSGEDLDGHGTHVAGIAAGRGRPLGVAPGAALISARVDADDLDGVLIALGDFADSEDMPVVVNISQGIGHIDPHDGSDGLSRIIDDFVGAGRLVCVAAGNEAGESIHLRADVDTDRPLVAPLSVDLEPDAERSFVVYSSGDNSVAITLSDPTTGSTLIHMSADDEDCSDQSDGVRWDLVRGWSDGPVPRRCVIGDIGSVGTPRDGWTWTAELTVGVDRGPVLVDVWGEDGRVRFVDEFGDDGDDASPEFMISGPAAAHGSITVGAMTSRDWWIGEDRRKHHHEDLIVGERCWFSNLGPTVDGRARPDLLAPGAMILSAGATSASARLITTPDASYRFGYGTSQATPLVSGLLALVLQQRPDLELEEVRDAISLATPVDPMTGEVGEVDAGSLVRHLL